MTIAKTILFTGIVAVFALCSTSFAAGLGDSEAWTQKSQSKIVSDQIEAIIYLQGMCDTMIRLGVLPNDLSLKYGTYSDLLLSYIMSSKERLGRETFVNFILMLNEKKFLAKDDKAILNAMKWVRDQK